MRPRCASSNFFGTYLWVVDTGGHRKGLVVEAWCVLSGVYFGLHIILWLEVEVVVEEIVAVCFFGLFVTGVGETTSFPLCSTCLICFVLFVSALGEMNG